MKYPKFNIGDDVIIHNPIKSFHRKVGTIMGCVCDNTSVMYDVGIHDYDGISGRISIDEEYLIPLYYPDKTEEGETMNFIELHLQKDGGEVYVNATQIASLRRITDRDNKVLYTKVCIVDSDEDYRVRETPEEIFKKMGINMAVNVF